MVSGPQSSKFGAVPALAEPVLTCSSMIKVRVVGDISEADLAEVRDLLEAVGRFDDHQALGEHKWLDLVHHDRPRFTGFIAEDPPHPHPVGYAHLSAEGEGPPPHWGLEVVVDPEHRGIGVEVALVEAALEHAVEGGGGTVHFWVFRPTQIHEALAHRLGFSRGRELFQMRRPLPHPEAPRWPAGTVVRRFVPGVDEDAWLAVNNRAFDRHEEQGGWDRATLTQRESQEWFDPSGFLLAEDDGRLTGFCWTKVHANGLGEIYVIAVDPTAQRTGLGKALVLGGLASLAERGVTTGMLYVDAANEGAVGLYRHLGFDVHHVDRAYVAELH
jgi:mycothiol synthase